MLCVRLTMPGDSRRLFLCAAPVVHVAAKAWLLHRHDTDFHEQYLFSRNRFHRKNTDPYNRRNQDEEIALSRVFNTERSPMICHQRIADMSHDPAQPCRSIALMKRPLFTRDCFLATQPRHSLRAITVQQICDYHYC